MSSRKYNIDLEGLFYVEDNTKHGDARNPIDKRDRGYWVMMKESEEGNMIVFTGLRLEIAAQLKERLEKAVIRHIMTDMDWGKS